MRTFLALSMGSLCLAAALADAVENNKPARRHGVELDLKTYPQSTAKEALASVLKAIKDKKIDYLLAHLSDPDWVDERVKIHANGFTDVVKEATVKLVDDPAAAKLLQRFLDQGEWQITATTASVRLKDVADRQVYFRAVAGRWFLENRQK